MKARLAVAAFPRAFPVATADRSVTSHNDPLISAPEGLAPDGVGKLALGAFMPTRGSGTAIGLISPLAVDIAVRIRGLNTSEFLHGIGRKQR